MAWFRTFPEFSSQFEMRDTFSDQLMGIFNGFRDIIDSDSEGLIRMVNSGHPGIFSRGHTGMTNNAQLVNNNTPCMNHRYIINSNVPHSNNYPDPSVTMHNHGQHMNVYPDRSASLYNNNNNHQNSNVSSNRFANGQINNSINGTATNVINRHVINNPGIEQYSNSSSSGQHSRNFLEDNFRNWLSGMNFRIPTNASLGVSFDPFGVLLEELILFGDDPIYNEVDFDEPDDLTQYDFEVPTVGLSETDVANIPVALAKDEKGKSCEICLCDVVKGEEIRILPCCHQFHRQCIDPWLRKNATCPNCRNKIEI